MDEGRRRLGLALLFVVHGLVHLWFVALASDVFELSVDPGWAPGTSWLVGSLVTADLLGLLAAALYLLATAGFVVGGVGYARAADWAPSALVATAGLSAVTTCSSGTARSPA